jgi:WS/DGAT/MGAT family acyltransferase
MERMTPNDAAILELEDDVSAAHGLTIGVFDGPEPDFDDLQERVEDRVRLVPRYRQRLLTVPFGLERPVWVDDPNFSADFHVRHTALPERRSRDPFYAFVSRCLSQRVDRGKPLWELWMVSGLPKKQWAIVSKVHYAIIDGVSGTDVLGLLADDINVHAGIGTTMPAPLPGPRQLVTRAVTDLMFDPVESFTVAKSIAGKPLRMARRISSGLAEQSDPNGLGRAVGPHRKWQSARVQLDDLRSIRATYNCSTTDVILAAVAGGIRRYLSENGKPLPTSIEVLVPLSVGAATGGLSGQVTTLTARLPIFEEDPVARLARIHEQTSTGAASSGATAGRVLRRQEDFVAPSILAQGVRSTMLETRDRRTADTVAINVPGPMETIEILGYPMVEAYPVIPLPGRVQIAMAAMSLCDVVYFGITSDFDSTTGLRYAAAGVVDSITELLNAD